MAATSKFERRFTNNTGEPLLGATIELVPQNNEYPNGKITLIEHPTRKGWYYKDGVPLGEYKIYINGSLYTQNIFHAENILYHLVGKFNDQLVFIGEAAPVRIQLPLSPPSNNKAGNIYFDTTSRTIKVDLEGNGQYISVGGGGGSQTAGVVLTSGNQVITGKKTFYQIEMSNAPASILTLPINPPIAVPVSQRRTGAIYYDPANNVLKISKDETNQNFLVLGSSEGENFISLHGLSVHDGQINGVGIYMFHEGQVYALPVRNAQNGYYAEDVPGAIYIDETNKRLLINFGRSHYGEDGAFNDEYFAVLPLDKMLEAIYNDPKILTGEAGQQREFRNRIVARDDASIDMTSGLLQIPDQEYMGNPTYYSGAIWMDNTFTNETGAIRFRLKVRFRHPNQTLYTKEIITAEEVKDYIQCGTGQFNGTDTACTITVNGGSINDIYFVTPVETTWNQNDMLIVNPEAGQFTVRRNSNGTPNLKFNWIRRKYGTY